MQDYLLFDIGVEDKSRIKGWNLQISDERDVVVKEFKMSDRNIDEGMAVFSFFKKFLRSKNSMSVPGKILRAFSAWGLVGTFYRFLCDMAALLSQYSGKTDKFPVD